eukprot:gene14516-16022_t
MENDPFKFVLTDKLSQDHIELLFSFIQSKGGWNNNPNVLQLKYALRKMILRNKITASNNANCHVFEQNTIIPVFKNNVSSNMERDGDDESTILYMIDNIDKSELRTCVQREVCGYYEDEKHQKKNDFKCEEHERWLTKCVADRYFTLRLYTYGKDYCQRVILKGKASRRHELTKLVHFKNQ